MLIFGKAIQAGVNGTNVDLTNLTNDNQLQGTQFDYRQVFTTLLQDWLGASNEVLTTTMFDGYAKIPLVDAAYVVSPDCYIGSTVGIWDQTMGRHPLTVSPNPAAARAEVAFRSERAFDARLSVHSLGGALVSAQTLRVQPGVSRTYLDVRQLPPATYFVRLEDKTSGRAEVVKLLVAR
jgi:hypothetical protein